MRKKLNKIVAMLVAVLLVLGVIGPVPTVKAADKMNFIVKTSSSAANPGDTITVGLWLPEGGNVLSFVGNLVYDTKSFELVGKRGTQGPVCEEVDMPLIDVEEGNISVGLIFDDPYNNGGLVYSIKLKVKDNPEEGATGKIGYDFRGGMYGTSEDNATTVPAGKENAVINVQDEAGKDLKDGTISISIPLESIQLNTTEPFTMARGASDTLTVTGTPENALAGKKITWTSSNSKVVSVDNNGTVTAVGIGTATVTATAGGKSASVQITVNAPLTSIALNKTAVTMKKGTVENLAVTYDPEDTTDDKTITWTSSHPEVASVSSSGKVTALQNGTTTITATVGDKTATCEVTVNVPFESVTLSNSEAAILKNQTTTITATVNPADTTEQVDVVWGVEGNEKNIVEIVEQNATSITLRGLKEGDVTLKATGTAGATVKTAQCAVHVGEVPIKSITVTADKDTMALEAGENVNLSVNYNPEETTDTKYVTWKSLNESVATVDENGVVTAVAGGETRIVATLDANQKITAEVKIKVLMHTTGISLNTDTLQILKNQTSNPLVVKFEPENTDDSKDITWKSSDETVATVDAQGRVTGIKEGTAIITATSVAGGFEATCTVTVTELHITDAELSEELNPSELLAGQNHTIKVTVSPETITDEVTYTYRSSDESVATVDENGVVHALKEGTAKITVVVTADNFEKELTYVLNVKEIPLNSIAFKEKVPTLEAGKTAQLEIIFDPQNTTADKTVDWSSSDESVATVENGLIKALKAGKTTITAKVGDMSVSYELTVTEKTDIGNKGNDKVNDKVNKADDKVNKADSTVINKAAKTGDTANVAGITLAVLLAAAMVTVMLLLKNMQERLSK